MPENILGDCRCINRFERDQIIKSLNRSTRAESNIIDDIRKSDVDLVQKGYDPTTLIHIHIDIISDLERTRNKVKNTPVCELMQR